MKYFFRIEVLGTDLESLEEIKDFFDGVKEPDEMKGNVDVNEIFDWHISGQMCFTCDLEFNAENSINKYKGLINGRWNQFKKDGLIRGRIYKSVYAQGDWHKPNPPVKEIIWEETTK